MGIHCIGNISFNIAKFVGFENPIQYTSHCFRRSSARVLLSCGADITAVKRHGGWRSITVAEGYIENLLKVKITLSNQLVSSKNTFLPSTSAVTRPGVSSTAIIVP